MSQKEFTCSSRDMSLSLEKFLTGSRSSYINECEELGFQGSQEGDNRDGATLVEKWNDGSCFDNPGAFVAADNRLPARAWRAACFHSSPYSCTSSSTNFYSGGKKNAGGCENVKGGATIVVVQHKRHS